MDDIFSRGKGEIVQQGRAEIRGQVHGSAALREDWVDLQQLAAA